MACCSWLKTRLEYSLPKKWASELGKVLWDAWKMTLISLFTMNVGFISIVICGRQGKTQLDGVSLAVSSINIIGLCMSWGLGSAFDTFFSQAFGSTDKKRVGVYLQAGIIFMSGSTLFCLTIFINSYRILIALNQDPAVARVTEEYLFYFSPGLPCIILFMVISKYLQAQKIVYPPLVIEIIASVVNIVLQYVLVYTCDLGIRGSAIAHGAGFATMLILVIVFILLTRVHEATWAGWSWDCLEDWGTIGKLGGSALLLICLDWWALEIGLFLIGTLGTVPLGAAGIMLQFLQLLYAVAQGTSIVWVYRIGRCLGQGDADGARRDCNLAHILTLTSSLILGLLMTSLMTVIPPLFTHDREVQLLATRLFPFGAIFLFADAFKSQLSSILRGLGKQFSAAVLSFFTLTFLTFAISVPLMKYTDLESLGYWIGANTGGILCGIGYIVLLQRIDWNKEVEKAALRIKGRLAKIEKEITESTHLLEIGGRTKRAVSRLIAKRIIVCFPFVAAFIISVALRVACPPYGDITSTNGTMTG